MTTFTELGLRDVVVAALAQQGITEPFPIQEQTIRDALAGRDVCGKAKTGSGKTLAFGLPLIEKAEPGARPRHPRALVLAPTRELAAQIVAALKPLGGARGLRVDAFYGGTPIDKQVAALRRGVDIAVATPGRMIDLLERGALTLDDVRRVVVDEADHMADMGFLPQVEWILRHLVDSPQVLLFSATLDGDVDVLVRHYLHDPVLHEAVDVESDDADASVVHRFFEVHQMDRVRVAAAIARGASKTIAFVRTKRGADRLTKQLTEQGVRAAAIHGDLRQNARERAVKYLAAGKLEILVATDVAARGIHIDAVDVVLHFDLPEDRKTYVHRSGRTARAGETGAVATFVMWDQMADAEKLKRQLGLAEPTVRVFSNDERLSDLTSFEATEEEQATGTDGANVVVAAAAPRPARRAGGTRGRGRRR